MWANNTAGWAIGSGARGSQFQRHAGGTGAVAGPVTVNSGGTLAPGAGGIGTLTINNMLALHGTDGDGNQQRRRHTVGRPRRRRDDLDLWGGTLAVTNLAGTLAAGDSFTLFYGAGSYSGNFTTIILPSRSAILPLDTAGLATNGTIKIYGPPSVAMPPRPCCNPATKRSHFRCWGPMRPANPI